MEKSCIIILWLAGLNSISKEIFESAKVDGATNMQCFSKITLPCLKPTLYTISGLSLLNSTFKVFREAYLVAGNYPDKSMLIYYSICLITGLENYHLIKWQQHLF